MVDRYLVYRKAINSCAQQKVLYRRNSKKSKKKTIVTVLDGSLDGTQFSGIEQCTWFVNI